MSTRAELAAFGDLRELRLAVQKIAALMGEAPDSGWHFGSPVPAFELHKFKVVDTEPTNGYYEAVGEFDTEAEAQACVVGLDYLDRAGAKAQRYRITSGERKT